MAKKDRKHYTMTDEIDPRTGRIKTTVTYTGIYYRAAGGFWRVRRATPAWAAINLFWFVFAGFQDGRAGHNLFAMLPYGLLALPSAFLLIAAVRMALMRENRFTQPERRQILERIRTCAAAGMVLGALCMVAGVIVASRNGWLADDIRFACAMLGCAVMCLAAFLPSRGEATAE